MSSNFCTCPMHYAEPETHIRLIKQSDRESWNCRREATPIQGRHQVNSKAHNDQVWVKDVEVKLLIQTDPITEH